MARAKKERVDVLLVELGLAETRAKAQALILAGKVHTQDRKIDKPGTTLDRDTELHVRGAGLQYVSRGGIKLQGALDAFALDVSNFVIADFGASTGGFTDCCLQRGASKVYAIDVGYGQLHEKLRQDPRVINIERTNCRTLGASDLPEQVDLVVIDASFIGLGKLLGAAHSVSKPDGKVLAMIKPQFEVGREHLVDGVVKDMAAREQACQRVEDEAQALNFVVHARADSVLKGPDGNLERFILLGKKNQSPSS